MINKERNYGLDLLRIVSMFMILILHFLGKNNILSNISPNTFNNHFAWFLESICIVAVNCYVLISGYFLIDFNFNLKRIFNIWGKVLFYSILIGCLMFILGMADLSIINILHTIFPVFTKSYWFITVYFCLCFISPFLNILIKKINKKQYRILLCLLFIMFCFIPTFVPSEFMLDLNGGTGIIWFVFLYLVAAYIRLYCEKKANYKLHLIKYFLGCIILFFMREFVIYLFQSLGLNTDYSEKLFMYNTIFVFIPSVYLFSYFKDLAIKSDRLKNIIKFIAPFTLSVYIIHEHPLFIPVLYGNIFHLNNFINSNYIFLIIFIDSIILFIVCILFDKLRNKISKLISNLNIVLKIKEKIFQCEKILDNKINYFFDNFVE